jgi:hypothetical protein
MQEIILKKDLSKSKMDALIQFLKSWDIEAEIKTIRKSDKIDKHEFPLTAGIWKDYDIDTKDLRNKTWGLENKAS